MNICRGNKRETFGRPLWETRPKWLKTKADFSLFASKERLGAEPCPLLPRTAWKKLRQILLDTGRLRSDRVLVVPLFPPSLASVVKL